MKGPLFLFFLFSLNCCALDREAFTFTNYDLNIHIEPEQQRLGVRGRIGLRNDSTLPQRSITLQISSSLSWRSISFERKPVEFLTQTYTSDIDHTGALSEAIVVMPQPVPPKQSVELEIGYEGTIPQDTTRLTRIGVPEDTAKHTDWDQIGRSFTAVRGIGYVAWYPIATGSVGLGDSDAVPESAARWAHREMGTRFDAELCIIQKPSEPTMTALMNDVSEQKSNSNDDTSGCQTYTYSLLGATVPVFVVGGYSLSSQTDEDIYFVPGDKSGADDYAAAIEEVVPLASKWFGDHRANAALKAKVVELPDSAASPFESGNMLLMAMGGNDTKLLLAAAEQATQLFFPSPQQWIQKGLARYTQVRLIEEKEGRLAAIQYLEAHRKALLELEKRVTDKKDDNVDSLVNTLDQFRVQIKALYVWWMLRDLLGDDGLAKALHNYKAVEDDGLSYMQKLIEAQAHRDLQWFFDDWVYHDRGLPDFRVASVYPSQLPTGGYMVTVTIENLGGAGAEIPIILHAQSGEVSQRLVVRGNSKASVRIQTTSLPQSVTVNDGSVPESDVSNNEYKIETLNH